MAMTVLTPSADNAKVALSTMASTVTVITYRDHQGRPSGMTATAFAPVSYDPLLTVICVNRAARTYPAISESGRFGVNILARDLAPVSDFCARPGTEKVLEDGWLEPGIDAASPVIAGALAFFDCQVHADIPAGEGAVIVGAVLGLAAADEGRPLLHHRMAYWELGTAMQR